MLPKQPACLAFLLFALFACTSAPDGQITQINQPPHLKPDYTDITLPPNIAPLNFAVEEAGDAYFVRISSAKGKPIEISSRKNIIRIPKKAWKNLVRQNKGNNLEVSISIKSGGKWSQFKQVTDKIAAENIDPYLYYRLLMPGYESWSDISIKERNLENFDETSLIENSVVDQNCVNCHAFNQGKTANFMFHMRGSMGGTYFVTPEGLRKFNIKTKEMAFGAVYPRWHPSGKYVAFSSNKIVQQFHAAELKKIEVTDLASSIILYDLDRNEVMDAGLDPNKQFMDTYPEWSPDGRFLYFSRAAQIGETYDYRDIKYNLYRAPFDPQTRKFGAPELLFDAASQGKSASFARISPNGKQLVFTYHNYGSFPIWHKDADLYVIDLTTLEARPLRSNSAFADSYHSWSSNGRWLIFSSKRDDGLSARPYIVYFDEKNGEQKPFILPQEDPLFYDHFLKTYNIPEFADGKITLEPGEIREVAEKPAIPVKWAENRN